MLPKVKRKVLVNTEASWASTGYGVIGANLIKRLYDSGKYHIAEFSSFAGIGDPRDFPVKWKLYCNEPSENDKEGRRVYNTNESNKTGQWRFDKVLLDFQPDIVISFRDTTMEEYMSLSPLRKFFYQIIQPSLDSEPQIDTWTGYHMQADCILGYTNYALDVIRRESAGKAKIFKSAYIGVDQSIFKPLKDKNQLRQFFWISPDANIIGMNGRNQIRKLFPELIKAFVIYLEKMSKLDQNTTNNSLLYLHTTLPDLRTWNINKLLVEYGVESKVLFTYNCTNPACGKYFPNKFQDVLTTCRFCGGEAILPRVNHNISSENLNQIYNLMDVYIQYANAGAIEMPLLEAASTGCNVMATDFAGQGDAVKRLGGVPINIKRTMRCINVDADRAAPDDEHLADELVKLFRRPRQINLRNGLKISDTVKKKFSWDKNADIWMQAIDNAVLTGYQGKWASQVPFNPPTHELPENIPIYYWVYNFIDLVLQEPDLKDTIFIDEMIKFVSSKARSSGNNIIPWGPEQVRNIMKSLFQNKLTVERIRIGEPMIKEDWLEYAQIKELANL